jgi:hypothetical protein
MLVLKYGLKFLNLTPVLRRTVLKFIIPVFGIEQETWLLIHF